MEGDGRKAMSAPKHANGISAKQMRTLRRQALSLSAQHSLLNARTNRLSAQNSEMKLRLQTMQREDQLQDAFNNALEEEILHLRAQTEPVMPNGGSVNFAPFGGEQQLYPTQQSIPEAAAETSASASNCNCNSSGNRLGWGGDTDFRYYNFYKF